jgi:O-antigen/teichoic acid export membrane protein
VYIAGSFLVAGVLTFAFQSLSMRALGGPAAYAPVALLWNATFLVVLVLWTGATQTLGRHVAEREARGEGWEPVLRSVRRWQMGLAAVFVVGAALASPVLVGEVFGSPWLTAAFVAAVVLYAPEFFRRGVFNGHRQPTRMGAQILTEAGSRVVLAAVLLFAGFGVVGPALAILLAPVIGFLAVRPAPVKAPEREGEAFSLGKALRFAGPVLVCMACAQALASGGVILVSLLGGTKAQVGLFGAALIFTRIPQYVLSPAIGALLPHASRALAAGGQGSLDRFVARVAGAMVLVGALLVGGVWVLGEWGLKVFGGAEFEASREFLVALAILAALYLFCDALNQALFALGRTRLAALAWLIALPVAAAGLAALRDLDVLYRTSYALALGTLAVALAQAVFYLIARRSASTSEA